MKSKEILQYKILYYILHEKKTIQQQYKSVDIASSKACNGCLVRLQVKLFKKCAMVFQVQNKVLMSATHA